MPSRKRKGVPGKCSLPGDYQHPPWIGPGATGHPVPAWLQAAMAMNAMGSAALGAPPREAG